MDVRLDFVRKRVRVIGSTVYLRGFDVIVEVVTECLDVRDNVVSSLLRQMSWEENYWN